MKTLAAFVALFSVVVADIPAGFVLDVQTNCANGIDAGKVTIRSDLQVVYNIYCDNNINKTGVLDDSLMAIQTVKYGAGIGGDCYFTETNAGVHFVTLEIFWGEPNSALHVYAHRELYRISCVKSDYKMQDTGVGHQAVESPFAPRDVNSYLGSEMSSSVTLNLVDVLDNNIPAGSDVPLGKLVKLVGKISSGNASGILPIACVAYEMGNTSNYYEIIRGGCGDGIIFPKCKGFKTDGTKTTSPYFRFFKLASGSLMTFRCNFTECNSTCNVSSCSPALGRKRRSAESEAVPKDDVLLKNLNDGKMRIVSAETEKPKVIGKVELVTSHTVEAPSHDTLDRLTTLMRTLGDKTGTPLILTNPELTRRGEQHSMLDKYHLCWMWIWMFFVASLTFASFALSCYVWFRQDIRQSQIDPVKA